MPTHPAIVAAVDLNSRASAIIRHGAKLAALCQGELLVVHIVDYQSGFESDHAPFQSPRQVVADMVRHARASLVGMVHHLELPTSHVGIRVESGPATDTLAELAAALHPRYLVVGQSRWGLLSPTQALTKAVAAQPGCELVIVPSTAEGSGRRLMGRVRDWVAGEPAAPSKPAR
jgi:K+-sensing histidine kinase KdpD